MKKEKLITIAALFLCTSSLMHCSEKQSQDRTPQEEPGKKLFEDMVRRSASYDHQQPYNDLTGRNAFKNASLKQVQELCAYAIRLKEQQLAEEERLRQAQATQGTQPGKISYPEW